MMTEIQEDLQRVEQWMENNKLVLNLTKTKGIFFFFFSFFVFYLFFFSFYRYSTRAYIWNHININTFTTSTLISKLQRKKLRTALHYKDT